MTLRGARRRTLMPQLPPGGSCRVEDGQLFIECGATRFSFPAAHVTLLPVASTTTEAIAAWLLSQLLSHQARIRAAATASFAPIGLDMPVRWKGIVLGN
jgi:hypothetical protein